MKIIEGLHTALRGVNKKWSPPFLHFTIRALALVVFLFPAQVHATDLDRIRYSANRVESWFKVPGLKEKIVGMGHNESRNKLGAYAVNVPGVYLKRYDKTIVTLSMDYGFIGVNNQSLSWTYQVTKALQIQDRQRKIHVLNQLRRKYYLNKKFIESIYSVSIPQTLQVRYIDPSIEYLHRDYKEISNLPPLTVRRILNAKYQFPEQSYNEIESIIIFRVLEELDRQYRGWSCFEGS